MPDTFSLENLIQVGDPIAHEGIVVCPLFPRVEPRLDYVTLDEAIPLGFTVTEIDEGGSVPELMATNPLDLAVLLYDGEELKGAKQDRILNVSVLAPAKSETRIPVSCVERGRWRYERPDFQPATHAAYPELRRRKAEALLAQPLAPGQAQSEVWAAVREKHARHLTHSPTGAAADVFCQREPDLAPLRKAFPLQPGQAGAILGLGEGDLSLDYTSRPAAFARLYPKLLDGYLLDALERTDRSAPSPERLEAFVQAIVAATRKTSPSAGLGSDLRLAGLRCVGSGLVAEGELIQLSAFTRHASAGTFSTHISRPSRRL